VVLRSPTSSTPTCRPYGRSCRPWRSLPQPWRSVRRSSSKRCRPARSPGEEDRYSGTDLWDFAANVEGAERGFELLERAIEAEDAELVATIEGLFDELEGELGAYRDGEGYQPYGALTDNDKTEMQTTLAELSENLATVAGVLGLEG
jgi:hypothetical protein